MRRWPVILCLLAALAVEALRGAPGLPSAAAAAPGGVRATALPLPGGRGRPLVAPGEWVVRFSRKATRAGREALHRRAGARVLSAIPQLDIQRIALPSAAAARLYRESADVLWVEPNRLRYPLLAAPNDPAYNEIDTELPFFPEDATWYEWDAHLIDCVAGWSLWPGRYLTAANPGTNRVRIAVIDSGIDYSHPDFRNAGGSSSDAAAGGQLDHALDRNIFEGEETPDAWDVHGHGTHVAGIAAAATNNGTGVTGNGYTATVMSLRVIDAAGNGSETDIAQAIVYAADHGALICNISLGGYGYSQAEQDAVDYAWSRGTLVIAAAGNDGTNLSPNYPAALNRVLAVSATGLSDVLATYSNWGDYIGIAAPGGDLDFDRLALFGIYSTTPTYEVTLNGPDYGVRMGYDYLLGTSMAAPQVAGLAALYAGARGITQSTPGAPLKIWQALQRGCDNIAGGSGAWDPYYGYGRINVFSTLNLEAVPNPRGAVAGCITGQVLYRDTPVANARIRAVRATGGTAYTATSRADGMYRIVNAPAGVYNVTATVFGESRTVRNVTVTAGCDMPGIDFNIGVALSPPAAPSNLAARAVGSNEIELGWSDNSSNEDGFRIERRTGADPFAVVGTAGPNAVSHTDTGLAPNTAYTYRIRAFNAAGESAPTAEASVTTIGAPSGLRASVASATRIALSWLDNATTETGFEIERKPGTISDPGSFVRVGTVRANIRSFANTVAAGGTYTYRARGVNATGVSSWSNTATVTARAPAAPSGLTARALSGTRVQLTWTDNSDNETGFRIEGKSGPPDGGEPFAPIASVRYDITSYAVSGLSAGSTYTFRVQAYNGAGASAYSNPASLTMPSPPAAPTDLTAALTPLNRVRLSWQDRSANETGFRIERRTGSGAFRVVRTVGANVTSAVDSPAAGATYTYRVRAYNAGGDSPYSNEATITVPAPLAAGLRARR